MYTVSHSSATNQNKGYIDGNLIGTGAPVSLSTADSPLQIGDWPTAGAHSYGDFAELLAYDGDLNDTQRRQVESYLAYKWLGTGTRSNILPQATVVTFQNDATLDINSLEQTVGGLSGQGKVAIAGGTLTVNSTADSSFAGGISGNGTFVKTGPAKFSMTGPSTFTGTTTVSAGTLEAAAQSLTTNVSVASNANLTINETAGAEYGKIINGAGSFHQDRRWSPDA